MITTNRDRDVWRDLGLLASVECVVDQLLQDHQRPFLDPVAGLVDQLLAAAELEQAGSRESLSHELGVAAGRHFFPHPSW
jgi:hypothetical protein